MSSMSSSGQTQPPSADTSAVDEVQHSGEDIVGEYYPAATHKGANRAVIGILVLLGFPLLIFFGLGLVLWAVALVYYLIGRSSGSSLGPVKYTLSNRRVWSEDIRNPATPVKFEEANLIDVSPHVMNKVTTKYSQGNQNSRYEISGNVGDVVFIDDRNHRPTVRFLHVSDPDGIKETVDSIKRSFGGA